MVCRKTLLRFRRHVQGRARAGHSGIVGLAEIEQAHEGVVATVVERTGPARALAGGVNVLNEGEAEEWRNAFAGGDRTSAPWARLGWRRIRSSRRVGRRSSAPVDGGRLRRRAGRASYWFRGECSRG